MAVLLEPILNQILQAEMTEHLGAEPGEQTDDRRGYRNGTYERKLTTRVGTMVESIVLCKSPGPIENEKGPRAALGLDILMRIKG
jgi:hypothetical protein